MKTLMTCTILLIAAMAYGQQNTLRIKFTDFAKQRGEFMVAVYTKDSFMKKPLSAKSVPVDDETITVKFKGLSDGTYAVAAFQDLNGNSQMDFKENGRADEAYGLSTNPTLKGRPQWQDTKFSISKNEKHLHIQMKE